MKKNLEFVDVEFVFSLNAENFSERFLLAPNRSFFWFDTGIEYQSFCCSTFSKGCGIFPRSDSLLFHRRKKSEIRSFKIFLHSSFSPQKQFSRQSS